jgi:ankyrin repeat protein
MMFMLHIKSIQNKILIEASKSGDFSKVSESIKNGANVNVKSEGLTPLGWATVFGNDDVAALLKRKGGNMGGKEETVSALRRIAEDPFRGSNRD